MLTGINFSPPLYFLFNFIIQLIYPSSIETLRVQSLVWTLIGITLSFLLARKAFGSLAAFIGTSLVLSQSTLLLSQSQDARHYTMFFACAAWVLLMQSCKNEHSKKQLFFTFLAHFCLCQIHYLGIIFSGLAGLAYLITNRNQKLHHKIPTPILLTWLISLPIYLFLLSKQSSHLGNWSKPNGITNLLATYNESFIFISTIIPIAGLLIVQSSRDKNHPSTKIITAQNSTVITTSILWLIAPILFWILSHISDCNLFVDRYYIPKELGVMTLLCFLLHKLLIEFPAIKLNNYKSAFVILIITISTGLLLVNSKRAIFSTQPSNNYYHWLLVDKETLNSELLKVYSCDHLYFPNDYSSKKGTGLLLLQNHSLVKVYSDFNKNIRSITSEELKKFKDHIFITDQKIDSGKELSLKNKPLNRYSPFDAYFLNDQIQQTLFKNYTQ